ncbi:hypothetical protein BZM27_51060 [Paraburkholderia steynii]|uniref:Uncharacterized protein n=1 Tax=Paraburkholderia steynii TaxID=1245441 RepID=A0A4V6N9C1_9BURK|nr:hypothetical protein BZM27_51060 [Paraburkholderia steynii]
MTSQREHTGVTTSLTVRAAAGQLRILPVWQALGPHAAYARRTRVHCSRKHNLDEITVMFEAVSTSDLREVTWRLNAQSWVVATSLRTVG